MLNALEMREIEQFDTKSVECFRTGKHDKSKAGRELTASKIDSDAVECHSLRFMDRDCPCEGERQPITVCSPDLCDRDDVRARRGEGRSSIAGEVDHDHACSPVVVWLQDVINNATRSIDKTRLHPQVRG